MCSVGNVAVLREPRPSQYVPGICQMAMSELYYGVRPVWLAQFRKMDFHNDSNNAGFNAIARARLEKEKSGGFNLPGPSLKFKVNFAIHDGEKDRSRVLRHDDKRSTRRAELVGGRLGGWGQSRGHWAAAMRGLFRFDRQSEALRSC